MEERHRSLLARAERSLAGRPVADAVGQVRAIIGPVALPAGEQDAEAALAALREGKVPTPGQLAALGVVIKMMRPAVLTRGGELADLPAYNGHDPALSERWRGFRERVRPLIYSIGRIDRAADGESFGTGFLASPDLVVTNRHVVLQLSFGTGELEPGAAEVRFGEEYGVPSTVPPVPVTAVAAIHESFDVALLRIAPQTERPPLPLATAAAAAGAAIAAVGYPFRDSIRNPLFMEAIYGDIYGVKRASPGEVVEVEPGGFSHDCSTLGGNSGSPLLSLDGAEVTGLHKSGMFLYVNEAVDAASLDPFVAAHA